MKTETREPILVSVEEAGRLLSLSRSKVYDLVRGGEIPARRVGGLLRIPLTALEALAKGEEPNADD